ncbi:MAG: hypothetical protein IPO22_13890 [Anaerolineales bacterium]|nr:hypothetical protein [Anaerolineales bacterium]
MMRKIFTSALIVVSSTLLILSIIGMVLAWVYNEPLTRNVLGKLEEVDSELEQAEVTLRTSKTELERTLRIVNATEEALNKFTLNDPQGFFEDVQSTLDEGLVTELETASTRLVSARDTLEKLRVTLFGLSLVPFLQINVSDQILTDLIDSADTLQTRIADVSDLAEQASTFLDDASFLLGGDFSETRDSLEYFLGEIGIYQQKVAGWRKQIAELTESMPTWIDNASLSLTIGLLWFAFSQFGLILHGMAMKRGQDPLAVLRTKPE